MALDLSDKLRLEPHPSRLVVGGVSVEAFPDYRQVICCGERAAYVGAPGVKGYALSFIVDYPPEVREAITDWVLAQGCLPLKVTRVPSLASMERFNAELEGDDPYELATDDE